MSRLLLALTGTILVTAGATILLAQERSAPRNPSVERRLSLAREGFNLFHKAGAVEDLDTLPIWSLRIMEAQRELGDDATGAAQEHLARMQEYAKLTAQRRQKARGSYLAVVDGQFRVAEAEYILSKAKAR